MVEGKASEGKEIGSLLSLRYALKRQASMGGWAAVGVRGFKTTCHLAIFDPTGA